MPFPPVALSFMFNNHNVCKTRVIETLFLQSLYVSLWAEPHSSSRVFIKSSKIGTLGTSDSVSAFACLAISFLFACDYIQFAFANSKLINSLCLPALKFLNANRG